MVTIQVSGRITAAGKLEAGLPPGDVQITIQLASDKTWTDEELEEILRPTAPLTGREIVESVARRVGR